MYANVHSVGTFDAVEGHCNYIANKVNLCGLLRTTTCKQILTHSNTHIHAFITFAIYTNMQKASILDEA